MISYAFETRYISNHSKRSCEPRIALILFPAVFYLPSYTVLQVLVNHSIVVPCTEHIQVQILADDLDLSAGHLEHRQADHLIVGRCEPLAIIILEIVFLDFEVKVNPERTQMRDLLGYVSVEVILFLLQGVLLRPVILDEGVTDPVLKGDGVGNSWVFGLIDCIEYLKGVCPYEFIVAIHEKTDLISLAVLSSSSMDVGHCSQLLLVSNHQNLALLDLVLL